MSSTIPILHTTEVDGVPTFWTEGQRPVVGALVFRVGRSDETLVTGGITHFVEHLAMSFVGTPRYEVNAAVDNMRTVFHAAGRGDEVGGFLGALSSSLASLPLQRIDTERGIVLREAETRQSSVFEALRAFRFGPAGHGLVSEPEYGLGWLGAAEIERWRRVNFVRENAALWLTAPPPADLRLDLPDGSRRQVVDAANVPGMKWPAHATWDANGVAFSMLVPRELGANLIAPIAQRRLRDELRFERGLVYDVISDYTPVTRDVAEIVIAADCANDQVPEVRDAILRIIGALGAEGPTEDELAIETDQFERSLEDPSSIPGVLDSTAVDVLLGRPCRPPEERLDEQRTCTAAHVASRVAEARPTALLLAAGNVVESFHPVPRWAVSTAVGDEYRPAGFALPGRGPKERLWVGPTGLSLRLSPEELLTVRWDDCVGVEVFDGGERIVHGRDGMNIYVMGAHWRRGEAAIDAIDAAIRPELRITGGVAPSQRPSG